MTEQTPTQETNTRVNPEIHVIPDQYYGAALKTRLATASKSGDNVPAMPSKKSKAPILIGLFLVLLLMAAGGYFVYQNREALFGQKPPTVAPIVEVKPDEPPPVQEPIPAPSAPIGLTASATNPSSVSLTWTDTASNESAYRVERRPAERTIYERVTDLPPNSTIFQDSSVQASSTYYYRIIARNETGESEPSVETMVSTPALPPPPAKQEPLPPAGLDTDSDGLTDLEEGIFKSDVRNPDADTDGFLDGNEVFNLYNPNGRAPAKLQGSGMVKLITGSIGWSMLIPNDWMIESAGGDGSTGVVRSGHGESFKIAVLSNDNKLPVLDWFMAQNPDADKTRIMMFKSKGGYEGIIGPDLLTTYIPWGNKIFTYTYDMEKQPFINYRTVYSLMLNSLVLSGLPVEMVQAGTGQLPFEPAATKPGAVTQPVSVIEATSSPVSMPNVEGLFQEPDVTTSSDINR